MLSLCWKSPHPSPNTGQMSSSKSICNAAAVKEAPSNAERLLCAQGQRAPKLAPSTPCRVHSFFILSLFFCSLVCTTLRVVRKFPRKSSRNVKASTQTWGGKGGESWVLSKGQMNWGRSNVFANFKLAAVGSGWQVQRSVSTSGKNTGDK